MLLRIEKPPSSILKGNFIFNISYKGLYGVKPIWFKNLSLLFVDCEINYFHVLALVFFFFSLIWEYYSLSLWWGLIEVTHLNVSMVSSGFPSGANGKEHCCHCWRGKRYRFDPWVRKIPWKRARQLIPVFMPGEFQGQSCLVGYGP